MSCKRQQRQRQWQHGCFGLSAGCSAAYSRRACSGKSYDDIAVETGLTNAYVAQLFLVCSWPMAACPMRLPSFCACSAWPRRPRNPDAHRSPLWSSVACPLSFLPPTMPCARRTRRS